MNPARLLFGLTLVSAVGCDHAAPPTSMSPQSVTPLDAGVAAGVDPAAPDASAAKNAALANGPSGAKWEAIVTGRFAIAGAAWTKDGKAVIVTESDIWTIDPMVPTKAHRTALSKRTNERASIAAREDSDVVAVALADGSIDVLVGSVLVKTLPSVSKSAYAPRLELTGSGVATSLVATWPMPHEWLQGRTYDTQTWASKPVAKPRELPMGTARPHRTPRADQAFALLEDRGIQITDAAGHVLLGWGYEGYGPMMRVTWSRQAIEVRSADRPFSPFYHFSTKRPEAVEAGAPDVTPPPTGCATTGQTAELVDSHDGTAFYVVQKDWIEGLCYCTNDSCKMTWLTEPPPGPAAEPLLHEVPVGEGPGGAFVSKTTADDEANNIVTLHPQSGKNVRTTVGALHCSPTEVAFVGERIFASCYGADSVSLVELSPKNLSVVARREVPAGSCSNMSFTALGSELLYGCAFGSEGTLLDPEWVKDAGKGPDGHLFLWPSFGILRREDGATEIAGKAADADRQVRCFDGENVAPFAACEAAFVTAP